MHNAKFWTQCSAPPVGHFMHETKLILPFPIVPYTFQRTIQKIVVPMGKELEDIKQKYLTVLEVSMVFISFHLIYFSYLAFFYV